MCSLYSSSRDMFGIIHGANPENLYNAFNIPMPERVIDFSTNTNILSWPEISINIAELASRYPDPECTRLRKVIASRENISSSRILFTNGTNQAIFLLSRLFMENVAILQPCYSEYSRAFPDAKDIFTLDEAGKYRAVIICNPNNPTGKYIADLSRTIELYPDTVFIVDEAYIDFLITAKPERLCDYGNVIILRSLTKIFHLSGARIGCVIASEAVISALKKFMPSWSVNAIAQELAYIFLNDSEFLNMSREFYRENAPKFMQDLRCAGLDVMNSDVHYFLVRVDDDIETIRHLLREGLVVRHTRNFVGLDGRYIRVAARRPEENMKLVEILKQT